MTPITQPPASPAHAGGAHPFLPMPTIPDMLSTDEAAALCFKLRYRAGDTQTELADMIGVTQPAISKAESGNARLRYVMLRILEHYTGEPWEAAAAVRRARKET